MAWKRGATPQGWFPRRGDVCYAVLDKERPVIILSSDTINQMSLDVCVVPISKSQHAAFTLRPKLPSGAGGLPHDSWAKCDQVFTIEKRLVAYPPLGTLVKIAMDVVSEAVRQSLDL